MEDAQKWWQEVGLYRVGRGLRLLLKWRAKMGRRRWLGILWLRTIGSNPMDI
jgi:hypothetical protein